MVLRLCVLAVIFLKIIQISGNKGSLTFVIDDTASMQAEIDQVKDAADSIMTIVYNKTSSPVQDTVLVTFNDPEWNVHLRMKTRNKIDLRRELHKIRALYGGDCPEYSMTGILKGLENSFSNSYLFVFTDASPKDHEHVNKVKSLAQAKQSQIVVILTPTSIPICNNYDPRSNFHYYYDIAASTFGQVFELNNKQQVKQILDYVAHMVSDDKVVIISVPDIPPNQRTRVPFTVDDQTEYVMVSASGQDVELDITEGPVTNYERITWIQNAKVLKINNPYPGTYTAVVEGSSQTSVMIFGRTDFVFQHGFSEQRENKFNDDVKQPTDGKNYHLFISVTDPHNSVNIQTAEILSTNGKILIELPLHKVSGNFYTTDSFLPPDTEFLIQVKGEGKKTGRPIRRKAKTPIQTRPKNRDPKITIEESGSKEFKGTLWLTCKVTASPPPNVIWKDENGNILTSGSTQKLNRYDYKNVLTIDQLTKSQTYYCYAENNQGQSTKRHEVTVKSPFIVVNEGPAVTNVEFEKSAVLHCNIKSKYSMQIDWYKNWDPLRPEHLMIIKSSDKYTIKNGGTELWIHSVKEEEEGRYLCRASLNENKMFNHEIQKYVKIVTFVPIMGERATIRVNENQSTDLRCNIKKAYPEPTISWQYKKYDSTNFQLITGTRTSKTLHVDKTSLQNAGVYKCIAHNAKGSGEHETEVIVLTEPKITLLVNDKEQATASIDYGSNISLICEVISHSPPTIEWKNSKNAINNPNEPDHPKKFFFKSYLTIPNVKRTDSYFCIASNDIKQSFKKVQVNVRNPLIVNNRDSITNVKYGEEVTLNCGITSRFPMRVTWSRKTDGVTKGAEDIRNSDKFSISEDGTALKIRSVSLDLQGQYTCKASLVNDETMQGEHTTRVIIEGLESPKIEKQAPIMKVRNGTKTVLKCKILKGHPQPNLNWFVKYRGDDKFITLNHSGEAFVIRNTEYKDTGVYKCEATNVVDKDEQDIDLTVEGPPVILSDEDIVYSAIVGDIVLRIPCVVDGYPIATITWLKDGKEIRLSDKYSKDADGTLVIKNPLIEDSSETYTCKAENKFGADVKTFEVDVTDIVRYDEDFGNETYIYLLQGETRKIDDCQSGPNVGRWFKQWNPTNMKGTFTITNASRSIHNANYTCRISSELGSKSHTYIVNVGFAPKFTVASEESDIEEREWEGEKDALDCSVKMEPSDRTVKIQWWYNNKTTDVQLQTHPVLGWGTYTCKISNIHGAVTKSFRVFSSTGCVIKRSEDLTYPLLLDTQGKWPQLKAEPDYFVVKKDDLILLSCRNEMEPLNTFRNFQKQEIVATCESENRFLVEGKVHKYEHFQCKAEVTSKVVPTGEKCAYEYTDTVKVGFNVDAAENHFSELYSVCFDRSLKVPLYSRVTMREPINYNNAVQQNWRNIEEYFSEDNEEYCDSENEGCCLKNTQLVNSMDVRQGPSQGATFIDGLNTVLVWNNCGKVPRNVTWQKVEEKVRSLLNRLSEIEMYTGADHYVKKEDAMVPRYLWKLYKIDTSYGAVVYVNDPNPTKKDVFCKTPCETYGVQLSDEFTYCCSLSEFQNHFTVPSTVLI